MTQSGGDRGPEPAHAVTLGVWRPSTASMRGWTSSHLLDFLGPDAKAFDGARAESLLPLVDPVDRASVARELSRALAEPYEFETDFRLCTGGLYGDRVHVVGCSTAAATGMQLVLSFSALGMPKRAPNEIEAMFQLVLDSMPVRVFWKGLDNNYLGCNHAFAQDAGLDAPAEIVGKSDYDLSWVEQAELYRGDDQRVMKSGVAKLNYEEPQSHPDGTRKWLRTSKVPLRDADGRVSGVLGCYEDITDAKQTGQELGRTQKLEAIGRLAGGIAHDFNNILTVLLGNLEILRGAASSHERAEALDALWEYANRAATLNRRLLAFSRQDPVAPRRLELGAVVRGAERMLRSLVGEDVGLDLEVGTETTFVRMDASQLEQVLMNLVMNARDAVAVNGRITVSTGSVDLTEAEALLHGGRPGPHARLSVQDTGTGIPDDVVDQIFDPFFTTKPAGRGTGLGLSTVHGIVYQSGGHVTVMSAVGGGTTMTVLLPLAEDASEASGPEAQREPPLSGTETVLLCDDDPALRRVVRRALEGHGYTVLEADQPRHALRLAEGHDGGIHLLLTDVIMPDMRGPELAQAVVARRPEIRVLYMSGYTADALERRADLGAQVDLLTKPFTGVDVLRRVRSALDRITTPGSD